MKDKHLDIRIRQCLILAEASGCPRRKFGAVLVDPERNVVLADGYNGGPRGQEGSLCRGVWCERDGLSTDDVTVTSGVDTDHVGRRDIERHEAQVRIKGSRVWACAFDPDEPRTEASAHRDADAERARLLRSHPPIPSGTHMELGCHHAESNVIANAAANGVPTHGSWMIVTGEPCPMCAKLMHHAGVVCVVVVRGGYAGGLVGIDYLTRHGVRVIFRKGPTDPRAPVPPFEMT
jgi:deoxycytidylate deaminase